MSGKFFLSGDVVIDTIFIGMLSFVVITGIIALIFVLTHRKS